MRCTFVCCSDLVYSQLPSLNYLPILNNPSQAHVHAYSKRFSVRRAHLPNGTNSSSPYRLMRTVCELATIFLASSWPFAYWSLPFESLGSANFVVKKRPWGTELSSFTSSFLFCLFVWPCQDYPIWHPGLTKWCLSTPPCAMWEGRDGRHTHGILSPIKNPLCCILHYIQSYLYLGWRYLAQVSLPAVLWMLRLPCSLDGGW